MPEKKTINPKDALGIHKVPIHAVSMSVMSEVGLAMMEGGRKYGTYNYRAVGVRASVQVDAVWRHLFLQWWEGEDVDGPSGLNHVTKAIADLVVLRDSMLKGNLVDDRPVRLPVGNPANIFHLNAKASSIINSIPTCEAPFTEIGRTISEMKPSYGGDVKKKVPIIVVYLDVDGVMADFIGGVHKEFSIKYSYKEYPYTLGLWDWYAEAGLTFEKVDAICTAEFWAGLDWQADGQSIFRLVKDCMNNAGVPISLLTTPMRNIESSIGKLTWIRQRLGDGWRRSALITGAPKAQFARPGALLIDDRDKNVEEFRAAGGQAILVPRPWNKNHHMAEVSGTHVKLRLGELGLCE